MIARLESESLSVSVERGIMLDKNNCIFSLTFDTKEKLSDTWRQKILRFSALSSDTLASWAVLSITVIGVYDLV